MIFPLAFMSVRPLLAVSQPTVLTQSHENQPVERDSILQTIVTLKCHLNLKLHMSMAAFIDLLSCVFGSNWQNAHCIQFHSMKHEDRWISKIESSRADNATCIGSIGNFSTGYPPMSMGRTDNVISTNTWITVGDHPWNENTHSIENSFSK